MATRRHQDRIDAAEQLAEHNPAAAAEAFSAIACDQAVGDEVRLPAAELLAGVDPRAAAPDTRQDADVRFWIAERWPGRLH